MTRRVVIVGGGVTGLATAWRLHGTPGLELTVLEAAERLGGQVATVPFAGTRIDVGAEAFLARRPEAAQLARELGLGDELVSPATGQVYVWSRGRLRPLPEGTVLGAPTDLVAVARSGVLSPVGVLRAAVEPLLVRRHVAGDQSVADLLGRRFGREVVDTLVEPLVGGVYAGSADQLSVAAAAPMIASAAASHRSLLVGLMAMRARVGPNAGPVFLTVRGGLDQLVDRMAAPLADRVHRGVAATALEHDGTEFRVHTHHGVHAADDVVLAVPAAAAAQLVAPIAPSAARELIGVRTASVAVVALAYEQAAAAAVPAGSGFLVPRTERRLIKAATFVSQKWAHHAAHDRFLVRASVGRADDASGLDLDDDDLAVRVDAELRWATGITAPAVERRVVRWSQALPQHEVGHLARVDRLRAALESVPGLHIGGAALEGIGLASRAHDAERLAAAVGARSAVVAG